jgi:hypothetical protein
MKAHGIIEPITVVALDDGRNQIVTGHRRYRAAKLAAWGRWRMPSHLSTNFTKTDQGSFNALIFREGTLLAHYSQGLPFPESGMKRAVWGLLAWSLVCLSPTGATAGPMAELTCKASPAISSASDRLKTLFTRRVIPLSSAPTSLPAWT